MVLWDFPAVLQITLSTSFKNYFTAKSTQQGTWNSETRWADDSYLRRKLLDLKKLKYNLGNFLPNWEAVCSWGMNFGNNEMSMCLLLLCGTALSGSFSLSHLIWTMGEIIFTPWIDMGLNKVIYRPVYELKSNAWHITVIQLLFVFPSLQIPTWIRGAGLSQFWVLTGANGYICKILVTICNSPCHWYL